MSRSALNDIKMTNVDLKVSLKKRISTKTRKAWTTGKRDRMYRVGRERDLVGGRACESIGKTRDGAAKNFA